jgi:hypothetical protein
MAVMRIVANEPTRQRLQGSTAVYVWPRALRCCGGHQYVLEASFESGGRDFELAHAADGFQVWTTPGLKLPDELHLEVDARNRPRAFWNGQAWVG